MQVVFISYTDHDFTRQRTECIVLNMCLLAYLLFKLQSWCCLHVRVSVSWQRNHGMEGKIKKCERGMAQIKRCELCVIGLSLVSRISGTFLLLLYATLPVCTCKLTILFHPFLDNFCNSLLQAGEFCMTVYQFMSEWRIFSTFMESICKSI